jgi:hypothetical protein
MSVLSRPEFHDEAAAFEPSRVDKFKHAALALGCDQDEGRWSARLWTIGASLARKTPRIRYRDS